MYINPIQVCDFYKVGHKFQYPEGAQVVFSNFTARSDARAQKTGYPSDGHVVFYNLQGFIKWFLIDCFNKEFFEQPKEKVLAEYKARMDSSLVTDYDVSHIADLHDLGYLPLEIRALPEGSLVPVKVPVFTIVNTHSKFPWLTNYIESAISSELWKATTSATTAYKYRELLEDFADRTGSPKEFVAWQGHDFSLRGLSGMHDAASSGGGHLLSFLGTDTIPAIQYLEDNYAAKGTFVGGSVAATEHSVMCMGGSESELETFRRIITKVHPEGVVSVVSDTWDFWKVITEYALELKPEILARKPNAIGLSKVVFRPDSGDPADILCGIKIEPADDLDDAVDHLLEVTMEDTPHGELGESTPSGFYRFPDGVVYEVSTNIEWNRHDKQYYYYDGNYGAKAVKAELTPEQKGAVECLWEIFGGTETSTGHKLLDSHVGLIYGDSITLERAKDILERLEAKGFASANVVFGIGSFTYQHVTRDTYGFAMKATWGMIDNEESFLFKDPKTDSGLKKSAKGLIQVYNENDKFVMKDGLNVEEYVNNMHKNELETVFLNGKLIKEVNLQDIRDTINQNLTKHKPVLK